MDCSMQDFPILHCLLELVQIQLSQWCYLTISSSAAPSSFWLTLSQHQVFSSELTLRIRWPKYWIFSFSMSPSSEYSGLISFRIDWFDLLAVQGTLSRVFSSTRVQKHQFFGAQSSLWSNSHIYTWLLEKPFLWLYLLLLPLFSDFLS